LADPVSDLAALLPSWELALDAAGKSPRTIRSYLDSVRALDRWLADQHMAPEPEGLRAYLLATRERTSAATAQLHYRNLRVFFGWLVREGETDVNPMLRVEKPQVAEADKPFFTEAELAALLRVTSGQDLESRRDHAILRIFIDTGCRLSGVANLRFDPADDGLNDVYLMQRRLRVVLKGGRQTYIPVGKKSAAAIDKYLRVRARSPHAHSPWLWLGTRGKDVSHFGTAGIRSMLIRRGREAGVHGCNPHRFRHTFADSFLAAGASVDDLMNIAGWTSYSTPLRYAKGRGLARAAAAHARLSPGDRL
jgi:integrase/recombinase XerD